MLSAISVEKGVLFFVQNPRKGVFFKLRYEHTLWWLGGGGGGGGAVNRCWGYYPGTLASWSGLRNPQSSSGVCRGWVGVPDHGWSLWGRPAKWVLKDSTDVASTALAGREFHSGIVRNRKKCLYGSVCGVKCLYVYLCFLRVLGSGGSKLRASTGTATWSCTIL